MNLIDARERLRDPNAVDIGNVVDELHMEDVGAVNKDTKCFRCSGCGHVAMNWRTLKGEGKGLEGSEKKNGKGLDNGQGKGAKIDGKVELGRMADQHAAIVERPVMAPTVAGPNTLNSCRGREPRQSNGGVLRSTTLGALSRREWTFHRSSNCGAVTRCWRTQTT